MNQFYENLIQIVPSGLTLVGCLLSLFASKSNDELTFFKRTAMASFFLAISFLLRDSYFASAVAIVCSISCCAIFIKNVAHKALFLFSCLAATVVMQIADKQPPYAFFGLLFDFSLMFMSRMFFIRLTALFGCLFWALFAYCEHDLILLALCGAESMIFTYQLISNYLNRPEMIVQGVSGGLNVANFFLFLKQYNLSTNTINNRLFDRSENLKLRPGWETAPFKGRS